MNSNADNQHGKSRVKGQLLGIPWLVNPQEFPVSLVAPGKWSMEEHVRAPVLPRERVDLFLKLLALPEPKAPLMNPLLASPKVLEKLPPTYFLVAGMDALRDEALIYKEFLDKAGYKSLLFRN